MSTWRDLSDDELKARLTRKLGDLHAQDIAHFVADRDDEKVTEILDWLLEPAS